MGKALVLKIPATVYAFSFIRPSVEAFSRECSLSEERASKLVLAAEEVFSYCCKLVAKGKKRESITVSFLVEQESIGVVIEYVGPQGTLEKHLSSSGSGAFSRDSFEALGLYLAKEAVDHLRYQHEFDGTNKYILTVEQKVPTEVYSRLDFIP